MKFPSVTVVCYKNFCTSPKSQRKASLQEPTSAFPTVCEISKLEIDNFDEHHHHLYGFLNFSDKNTDTMSNRASFTLLPREIRDMIYKEALVLSVPEHMFYTTQHCGQTLKEGHGLLHSAFSTQQIAREACEVYYRYNTFEGDAVFLSRFLASKIHIGGGKWFFPSEHVRKIIITITFFGLVMSSIDVNSRELYLSCPKLQTIVLESFAHGNPIIFIPRSVQITEARKIVYLGRRLKKDLEGINLDIYLHNFYYRRNPNASGGVGDMKYLDGTLNVSWLVDRPDQEMVEKVEQGQGSDKEWLMVQMATYWAPIGQEHGADQRAQS